MTRGAGDEKGTPGADGIDVSMLKQAASRIHWVSGMNSDGWPGSMWTRPSDDIV